MDQKLTLKLDDRVIERAKVYAQKKNISLSKLIESYLKFLTSPSSGADSDEITPLVKSLSGIIKFSKPVDPKDAYKKHLRKKYNQ